MTSRESLQTNLGLVSDQSLLIKTRYPKFIKADHDDDDDDDDDEEEDDEDGDEDSEVPVALLPSGLFQRDFRWCPVSPPPSSLLSPASARLSLTAAYPGGGETED